MSVKERVIQYFDAFNSADRKLMESLLSEDFRFTSPYDDHIDRRTYFERCWVLAGKNQSHKIITIIGDADQCFVTYEGKGGTGTSFRNTELWNFKDGLLRSVEVFFGLPPERHDQKDVQARGRHAHLAPPNHSAEL